MSTIINQTVFGATVDVAKLNINSKFKYYLQKNINVQITGEIVMSIYGSYVNR